MFTLFVYVCMLGIIIHYFSMKMYSNRRKLNKIAKELENENNKVKNSK